MSDQVAVRELFGQSIINFEVFGREGLLGILGALPLTCIFDGDRHVNEESVHAWILSQYIAVLYALQSMRFVFVFIVFFHRSSHNVL